MLQKKNIVGIFAVLRRWRESGHVRKDIDVLLSIRLSLDSSFDERINWFIDLTDWIRASGLLSFKLTLDSNKTKLLRVKHLLRLLENNAEWKKNVQHNFQLIIENTEAVDLFMSFGMSTHGTFLSDLSDRLSHAIMPEPHRPKSLDYIVGRTFTSADDVNWILSLDEKYFSQLIALFVTENNLPKWKAFKSHAKKAILAQSIQVVSLALDPEIKDILGTSDFQNLPFFNLLEISQVFDHEDKHVDTFANQFFDLIIESLGTVDEVYSQIEKSGVSVSLVYHLDLMRSLLLRMRMLMRLVVEKDISPLFIQDLFTQLVSENIRRRSIRALMSDNIALLSKKIIESSAKTGHHYITRDWKEYWWMFKSALGGGVVTAGTTLLKLVVASMALALFPSGFLNSFNFIVSFLLLQYLGFTLATKQPAMTAAALAEKMENLSKATAQDSLVDEVICILRSQLIAIFGNLMAVIPVLFLVCFGYQMIFQDTVVSDQKAKYTIESFSILGPTPFYAIFTGFLLFASSLAAGWAENWVHVHRLSKVILQNRRLNYIFGTKTVLKMSEFTERHFPAMVGNISLGLFLGMVPVFAIFFGLPIDVRHVTLSTGGLTVASMNYGFSIFQYWIFWSAVLGILSMAVFNLLTSFALSIILAVRSRKITPPQRNLIYSKLWKRLKKNPMVFFFPTTPKPKQIAGPPQAPPPPPPPQSAP